MTMVDKTKNLQGELVDKLADLQGGAPTTEREAFERWFGPNAAEGCWAKRDIWDTDQYQSPYTQTAWLAWQASRQQALEEIALPRSYGGSTLSSWGDQKQGCTIRLHFTDAAQGEAWFERVGGQWDERRSLTPTGDKA